MLCYRDRIFCKFLECKRIDCDRRLTRAVRKAADNFGAPISQFIDKPDCYAEEDND